MFNFPWFFLRFAALFALFAFLVDIEIGLGVLGFILLHVNLGLRTLLNDYIHIPKIKLITLSLMRVLIISLTVCILGLLL